MLQWGRDLSAAETLHDFWIVGFTLALLQWGRDLSAAETSCELRAIKLLLDAASMGPRPLGRGDRMASPLASQATRVLQWGRDLSAAETSRRGTSGLRRSCRFNGAATSRPRRQGQS